jgi:hypothetical protein
MRSASTGHSTAAKSVNNPHMPMPAAQVRRKVGQAPSATQKRNPIDGVVSATLASDGADGEGHYGGAERGLERYVVSERAREPGRRCGRVPRPALSAEATSRHASTRAARPTAARRGVTSPRARSRTDRGPGRASRR